MNFYNFLTKLQFSSLRRQKSSNLSFGNGFKLTTKFPRKPFFHIFQTFSIMNVYEHYQTLFLTFLKSKTLTKYRINLIKKKFITRA